MSDVPYFSFFFLSEIIRDYVFFCNLALVFVTPQCLRNNVGTWSPFPHICGIKCYSYEGRCSSSILLIKHPGHEPPELTSFRADEHQRGSLLLSLRLASLISAASTLDLVLSVMIQIFFGSEHKLTNVTDFNFMVNEDLVHLSTSSSILPFLVNKTPDTRIPLFSDKDWPPTWLDQFTLFPVQNHSLCLN